MTWGFRISLFIKERENVRGSLTCSKINRDPERNIFGTFVTRLEIRRQISYVCQ